MRRKWPKELDERIKQLYEKKSDWGEIYRILKSESKGPFLKKLKEIK